MFSGIIPEDPVRYGYTFGEWHGEEECITKCDFEVDAIPEAQYDLWVGEWQTAQ